MRKILGFIFSMCILSALLIPMHASAEVVDSGVLYSSGKEAGTWELSDNGVLTLKGEGNVSFDNKPNYTQVYNIIVGEGITAIYLDSFDECTQIYIPSTLIDMSMDLIIPKMSKLEEITISPNHPDYTVVDNILYNKDMTEILLYPESKKDKIYTVPETVTSISQIGNDYIEEIILPGGLKTFMYIDFPNLKKLTIPESVESLYIGYYTDFALLENGLYYLGNDENPYLWLVGAEETISNANISKLTKRMADCVFNNCDSLTSVTIPDNIEYLSGTTFNHCKNLEEINVGSGITSLPDMFCYGEFSKLKSINVSDNLKTVGSDSIWVYSGMSEEYYDPITGVGGSHSLPVPIWDELETLVEESLYYLGNKNNPYVVLFNTMWSEGFDGENLVLPDTLKSIGAESYGIFPNIKTATIPKSLTYIAENAFLTSESLTDVYYGGTKKDWEKIEICAGNDYLLNANIHFTEAPAVEITDFSAVDNGTDFDIDFSALNVPDTADAYIASYDANGRLLEVHSPVFYNETATALFSSDNVSALKAFIWDDDFEPLTNATVID